MNRIDRIKTKKHPVYPIFLTSDVIKKTSHTYLKHPYCVWYSWIQENMLQNGERVTIDRIKRAETHPVYPVYPVQKTLQ